MKKRILMSVLGVVLSGFLIFGAVSYFNHQTELKCNREYEMSLAKALKNSYKDIKEIQFSNPSYSDKPGGWYVRVKLNFNDGEEVEYSTIHALHLKTNYGGSIGGKEAEKKWNYLDSQKGITSYKILIVFSDGSKGEIK